MENAERPLSDVYSESKSHNNTTGKGQNSLQNGLVSIEKRIC